MNYNGLENKEQILLRYVWEYSDLICKCNSLKKMRKDFPHATILYEERIKKLCRLVKCNEIKEAQFIRTEFLMTKIKQNYLESFCRHLRNSIAHYQIRLNQNRYIIQNVYYKKMTANGELDMQLLEDFLECCHKDYLMHKR